MCVPFIINQTPAAGGDHCHDPQRTALSGLWAIPSTESGPQPLLDTYNLSSLALTPGEPTPYVCMYVGMVCGMYVSMCWVWRESTQVHREGGTVSSKGKKCSVCDHGGTSSPGAGYVRDGVWAIIGIHAGLVRPRADLENEITHKNVQKKVECDPCAISSCETNLVRECVFSHARGKE